MINKNNLLWMLLILFVPVVFYGCTKGIAENTPKNREVVLENEEERRSIEIVENSYTYKIYYIRTTETSFLLEPEEREFEEELSPSELAKELVKNPKNLELSKTIPDNTKILGVTISNGLATINFSQEIASGSYGSEAEMLTIQSILKTLTQLPGVDRIQILIEGEKVETLWGHADIREPIQ